MNDQSHIATGVIGAILAALCCAAPLLLVAVGSAGVTAWIANAYYVLVPAVLIFLALVGLLLHRRWTTDHGSPNTNERGTNHERLLRHK